MTMMMTMTTMMMMVIVIIAWSSSSSPYLSWSCSGITVRPWGASRHFPRWVQTISEGPQWCWGAISILFLGDYDGIEDHDDDDDDDDSKEEKDGKPSATSTFSICSAYSIPETTRSYPPHLLHPKIFTIVVISTADHLLSRIDRGISTRPWSGAERGWNWTFSQNLPVIVMRMMMMKEIQK